jgi:hypothetical protein
MTRKKKNEDLLDPKDIGMTTRPKSQKKSNESKPTYIRIDGVYGILMIPVIASIAYNVFLVLTGTQSQFNQIMAIPAVAFVGLLFIIKFWK